MLFCSVSATLGFINSIAQTVCSNIYKYFECVCVCGVCAFFATFIPILFVELFFFVCCFVSEHWSDFFCRRSPPPQNLITTTSLFFPPIYLPWVAPAGVFSTKSTGHVCGINNPSQRFFNGAKMPLTKPHTHTQHSHQHRLSISTDMRMGHRFNATVAGAAGCCFFCSSLNILFFAFSSSLFLLYTINTNTLNTLNTHTQIVLLCTKTCEIDTSSNPAKHRRRNRGKATESLP